MVLGANFRCWGCGYGVGSWGRIAFRARALRVCAALRSAGDWIAVDKDKLGMWVIARHTEGGGLREGPRLEDVCYSCGFASRFCHD